MRVGLLGGSFNPAHSGHRAISLAAIEALCLDEVWWLVSPGNPLKDKAIDMAPFAIRFASARQKAAHAPIRVSAIETRLGTRYTVDTLAKMQQMYRRTDFIWLMGEDNLINFDQWKGWRRIARSIPIAVIARPGYDHAALAVPAMGWLRRFFRPVHQAKNWTTWRLPALVLLRFRPDRTSATRLRMADPAWQRRFLRRSADSQAFTTEPSGN